MKRQIITIAGNLGSGKSTTAKLLAARLKWPHYSSGDFMRKLAEERKMTLNELSILAEKDSSIDILIDKRQKEFMDKNNQFVIDSRLGFFWAPESFKILLTVDLDVAVDRVFKDHLDNQRNSESAETKDDVRENLVSRFESEKKRYFDLYGIVDQNDSKFFDIVIDTGNKTKEETVQLIFDEYQKWIMLK